MIPLTAAGTRMRPDRFNKKREGSEQKTR